MESRKEIENLELPDSTDPSLVLIHPTNAEKEQTWAYSFKEWGGALSKAQYLEREPYLTTVPLARDGGLTHWILTTSEKSSENRPVLASCESIRKRVLVAVPSSPAEDGSVEVEVRERYAFGIGSVFTYPQYRRRRYASRLLNELGATLKTFWQLENPPDNKNKQRNAENAIPSSEYHGSTITEEQTEDNDREIVCSALWSDIGKQFYARHGWAAFPSLHVEFPVLITDESKRQHATKISASSTPQEVQSEIEYKPRITLRRIEYEFMDSLCARDEHILRTLTLPRSARETGKTCVAFAPDFDTMRWHLYRDEFITRLLFPTQRPDASYSKGVIAEAASSEGRNKKVWALWIKRYHAPQKPSEEGMSGSDAKESQKDSSGKEGDNDARPLCGEAELANENTLYILRLAIDDGRDGDGGEATDADDEDLSQAFRAVMSCAEDVARDCNLAKIDLWNPSRAVRRLLENYRGRSAHGIPTVLVDREYHSIPSLNWYGIGAGDKSDADGEEVEWVANERYCWC